MPRPALVLASTSPYRRELLERLRIPFSVAKPGVAEDYIPGEPPAVRAERLSVAKAVALASAHPDSILIGSDQVAALGDTILDKPGDHATARKQLLAASGQRVVFHTGLAVHHTGTRSTSSRVVPCTVQFRELDVERIERYLALEQPFDCAGSAKAEALGISLIARMESNDPTAIIGLPLIALVDLLAQHGIAVP